MNCEKAKSWLLTQHADEALPSSVGRHVLVCQSCQKLQNNLKVLDKHAETLPVAAGDPKAKQRFLARFGDTPQEAPLTTDEHPVAPADPPPPRPARFPRWGRIGAGLAAAVVLFAVGWAGGRFTAPVPTTSAVVEFDDPTPVALTTALLELNVELVKATNPAERLAPLRRMADVLWENFADRIENGTGEDVLSLTALQEHLWRYGLLDGVRQLPKEQQKEAVAAVVQQLQRMRGEAEQVMPLLPVAMAECVQRLLLTWQEVEPELQLNRAPLATAQLPQLPFNGTQSLPTQLVACSLRLGREGDPLQRAELCATMAKQIAQHAAFWSSQSTKRSLQPLTEQWEAFVKQGINANLERLPPQNPAQTAKMEQIRATTKMAFSMFENHSKQWLGGPPPGWPRGPETFGKGGEKGFPSGWNKDRNNDFFGKNKSKGKFPFPFPPNNKKRAQGNNPPQHSAFASFINRQIQEGVERSKRSPQHRRAERHDAAPE
jgi:hypothetical protein